MYTYRGKRRAPSNICHFHLYYIIFRDVQPFLSSHYILSRQEGTTLFLLSQKRNPTISVTASPMRIISGNQGLIPKLGIKHFICVERALARVGSFYENMKYGNKSPNGSCYADLPFGFQSVFLGPFVFHFCLSTVYQISSPFLLGISIRFFKSEFS